MGSPGNPYFPGSDQYAAYEAQYAQQNLGQITDAGVALQHSADAAAPQELPSGGVPTPPAGPAPAPEAPVQVAKPAEGYASDEVPPHIVAKQVAAKEALRPQVPDMVRRSPGSSGGLDALGTKARYEYPIQVATTEEAARLRAQGVNAKSDAELASAQAMYEGLARSEEISAQQQQARADYEASVDRYRTQLEKDAETTSKEKISPRAYFHGENATWNTISAAIGLMFGGALAGLQGGSNQFEKTLNHVMDQDLEQQKFALESKAKGRATYLQGLRQDMDKYGSMEGVLAKRRADMWDQVAKEAEAYRTEGGSDQIRSEASAMLKDAQAQASAYRMKAAEYIQKHTVAPSGGGTSVNPAFLAYMEQKNPGFQVAWAERVEKLKKGGMNTSDAQAAALYGDASTDEMRRDMAKFAAESSQKRQGQLEEATQDISKREVAAGIPARQQALSRLSAVLNTREPGEENPAGVGVIKQYVPSILLSEQGRVNRQEITRGINDYIHNVTGATATPQEMDRLMAAYEGAIHGGRGLEQTLQAMTADFIATRNAIAAGHGSQAVQEYEARKRQGAVPTVYDARK